MAPQETRSAMYCGLMGSRNSVPAGRPSAVTCCRKRRAARRPGGDVVAAVEPGIVDQALPAHRGARLLEVRPHHDQQVFLVLLGLADQPAGVFQAGLGIVDGAGADNDQQAVIDPVHDGADLVPAPRDDVGQPGVQRQFRDHVLRGRQRGELADAQVRGGLLGFGGCFDAHVRGSCSGVRSGPRSEPAGKWRRAENDLCPVGSEGRLDACQLDAGPSRANEKYAYQRLVMTRP